MKAIRVSAYGGPEVMKLEDVPAPQPGAGQVLVRNHAVGVNPVALLVTVGVASSMDFSLPVGNPPNAIVFASGRVRVGTMVKGGVVLSLLCIFLITFIAFPLANWIFPWPG